MVIDTTLRTQIPSDESSSASGAAPALQALRFSLGILSLFVSEEAINGHWVLQTMFTVQERRAGHHPDRSSTHAGHGERGLQELQAIFLARLNEGGEQVADSSELSL